MNRQFGVAWYPEHWPEDRWPQELRLMRELGIDTVRIGEFAWCFLHPSPGVWDFGWLDRAIAAIHAAGLRVILCTPTACPPKWMLATDPGIVPVLPGGHSLRLGNRRNYSPHHPGYRAACREVARKLAQRYGQHPAVVAWQIDNEVSGEVADIGPVAVAAFRNWLRREFRHLTEVNRRLGLHFWGQHLSDWSEVTAPPDLNPPPGLAVAWSRFVSEAWISFVRDQVEEIRPHSPDRIVTTNCFLFQWGTYVDWHALVRDAGLDRFSLDNYAESPEQGALYQDVAASLTRPHWVLEQALTAPQAQYIWPDPGLPGTVAAPQAMAYGAELVAFFHWRQFPAGVEQCHTALLDHDGRPGHAYELARATIAESRRVAALTDPRIGIVFTWEDAWVTAAGKQPLDYIALHRDQIHPAIYRRGGRARFCFTPDHVSGLRLVIVAARTVRDPAWDAALGAFLAAGGTVVMLPGYGRRDADAAFLTDDPPASTQRILGGRLRREIVVRRGQALEVALPGGVARYSDLIEEIEPAAQAAVLARFGDGPIGGAAALIEDRVGPGRVLRLAGFPDANGLATVLDLAGI